MNSNASVPAGAPDDQRFDFRVFLTGRAVSSLGSALTRFALPLLVYQLTGSAVNLALTAVATNVPYLLFGLPAGAWVDRLDRKRVLIVTDLVRGAVVGTVPLMAALDSLPVAWIYVVVFVSSAATIAFEAAQFAVVPSLVSKEKLVTANGRLRSVISAAVFLGPALGGLLVGVIDVEQLLVLDALSFVVSAASIVLLRTSFRLEARVRQTTIGQDIVEGVRYVFNDPVLRNISVMMALVNLAAGTVFAQLVLLAKTSLDATDSQVGYLFAAGAAGATVVGMFSGWLRDRLSFAVAALGSLMLGGAMTVVLGATDVYLVALLAWAVFSGFSVFFNVNTASLRQAIAPPGMLGRVVTVAQVVAWSLSSVGFLLGAWVIESVTGGVATVYVVSGIAQVAIALGFWVLSPLRRADQVVALTEPGA